MPVVEDLLGTQSEASGPTGMRQTSAHNLKPIGSLRRVQRSPLKLIGDLLTRLQTFSSAITAMSEAANADFPRRASLRRVVKGFRHETRRLLVKLKVMASF